MAKIQGLATSSPLHIISGDSGGTANAAGDELIVEGSGDVGMQFLAGTSNLISIFMGDSGGNAEGRINFHTANQFMQFYTNSVEQFRVNGNGVVQMGAIGSAPATAAGVLNIFNDVSPTAASPGGIAIGSKDSSDGALNATLEFWTEQAVEAIGTFTPSQKLKIWINGTEYWIQLDAV